MAPHKKKPRRLTGGVSKKSNRLTFAVLEAFACAGLAVLLALAHARITREQAFRAKSGPVIGVHRQKSPSQTMSDSACLSIQAAAMDCDAGIEFVCRAGGGQRLSGDHAHRFNRKVILERTAVDGDFAVARREANARHGGLAAAGAEMLGSLGFGDFDVSHLEN
jgi:hypothetical protein